MKFLSMLAVISASIFAVGISYKETIFQKLRHISAVSKILTQFYICGFTLIIRSFGQRSTDAWLTCVSFFLSFFLPIDICRRFWILTQRSAVLFTFFGWNVLTWMFFFTLFFECAHQKTFLIVSELPNNCLSFFFVWREQFMCIDRFLYRNWS